MSVLRSKNRYAHVDFAEQIDDFWQWATFIQGRPEKGPFAVLLLVLCILAALAAGLLAIYVRLSPLQGLQDKAAAHQGAQEGQGKARVTEGEELLKELRSLIKELGGTVHLERSTANERRDQLQEERAAWEARRAQLSAERSTSEALCAQNNTARLALEKLCLELHVERVDLLDFLYRAFSPARVNHAVATIKARRAEQERAREEETKPEGIPTRRATPDRPPTAAAAQEHAQGETQAALAGQGQLERARDTMLPTTREDLEKQRELLAATKAGGVDADDTAAAHALSQATSTTALEAEAGGATLSPRSMPRALHSGAVAPPASAPMPLASDLASKAAGLGPTSSSSTSATSFFEDEADKERERDTEAGAPPRAPKPSNDDGEATEVIEIDEAALQRALHSPGLRGIDGVPEATSERPLNPNKETPRKARMSVLEAGN